MVEESSASASTQATVIEQRPDHPVSTDLRRAGRLDTDDVRLLEKVEKFNEKQRKDPNRTEMIIVQRTNEVGCFNQLLMGKSYRNPITGQVRLAQCPDVTDITFVDLYTRYFTEGTLENYVQDGYFFKAIPLLHRTWYYHRLFHSGKLVTSGLEVVFKERMIDARVDAGQWSPVMSNVIGLIGTVLMRDRFLGVSAVITMVFVLACTVVLEDPCNYHQVRPVTFPVRIASVGIGLWRFATRVDMVNILGFAIFFLAGLIDHVWGDGRMLVMQGAYCSYEIKREVSPNQLYICERKGASFFDEACDISYDVTGYAVWPSNMVLIGEVNGVLAELRPMTRKEWELIAQNFAREGDRDEGVVRYYGMDIYDGDTPTWDDMRAEEERAREAKEAGQKEAAQKEAAELPVELS